MDQIRELTQEQAYTARVQQLLLALIEQAQIISSDHLQSIHAIVADAWEELRVKPTALSEEDLEQLSTEVDRFVVRRQFADSLAERSRRMLMNPFFARVDFAEDGEAQPEKIVIGLYSLKDEKGALLVHDWRAPVCSLYYDAMPGEAEYDSPSGRIHGSLALKRQYRMEDGRLKYFVDTVLNIDDSMLLDILSGATSRHMRQIVATIQAEQNAAIRQEDARVVSVVGGAGSGKTSVAMHRAAYLMYRRRDLLDASKIMILSPSTAFSEYVSGVLPELGEENIRARTLREVVEGVLNKKVEKPYRQLDALLSDAGDGELRRTSVAWKSGAEFLGLLKRFADDFTAYGPEFRDVRLDGKPLIRRDELARMYRGELSLLTPAQKLMRMAATLQTRLAGWEERLYSQYEKSFSQRYGQRELRQMSNMAVAQRLQPVRAQLREQLEVTGSALLRRVLRAAPKPLRDAYEENLAAGLTWWEDAVAEAYLTVRLGFAAPDKTIYHLLVDEAQDYSDAALAMLGAYYPNARVTLLGDPKQRTTPGMEACDPARWGACFGMPDAQLFPLTRCYRSTMPIARLCNRILPDGEALEPFGRDGQPPLVAPYSEALLRDTLDAFRAAGHKSIAVITRSQSQADSLSARLENVYRLDGGEADLNYESGDNVVACYHLTKGMEFDAVVVVWPEVELNDGERRRLYTAASRALHAVALLAGEGVVKALEEAPAED
ncbi:MAG: AAA family ATPase [Clostridia bacterium]|nr:AAA family ATPase [Clostridia bacterium]